MQPLAGPPHPSSFPLSPSLSDNNYPLSLNALKKRKVDRACDACRRRKTRCDGPRMPDNVCSNCIQSRKTCTYVEMSKPRGPPKAYITSLEDKMEAMEALLKGLYPNVDFSNELGPPVIRDSWKNEGAASLQPASSSTHKYTLPLHSSASYLSVNTRKIETGPSLVPPSPLSHRLSRRRTTHLVFETTGHPFQGRTRSSENKNRLSTDQDNNSSSDNQSSASSDVDELVDPSADSVRRLTLRPAAESTKIIEDANSARFHGKSSATTLIDAARRFRELHIKEARNIIGAGPVDSSQEFQRVPHTRRSEFWRTPRWEISWEGYHLDSAGLLSWVVAQFPPPDLATELINNFFAHINYQFPLLHRPTFERQYYKEKLYHRDIWFACVCHSLFAVACRWSNDPRVVSEGATLPNGEPDWRKAGWKYFDVGITIHRLRRSLFLPTTLFEVQTFTLLGMFLRGTSAFAVGWLLVSIGLRKAQDVGAHRRKVYRSGPTVDDELWKRAFWLLVVFDCLGGTSLGRCCGFGQEDFDLEMPLEVDDEYWESEDPSKAFQQPPGVPALVASFNCFVRLTQVLTFALKTAYAINKSKVFFGLITGDWKEEVIRQLEIAMGEWFKNLPEHLKWSDKMTNPVYASQSATIHSLYYFIQMLIYRPFISSSSPSDLDDKESVSPVTKKAMDVCTAAARACVRIVQTQIAHGMSNIPNLVHTAYHAAGQLLLRVWDIKMQEKARKEKRDRSASKDDQKDRGTSEQEESKPPPAQQIDELMAEVHILINALERVEPKWEFVMPIL
ncbi:hypothetical protein AMATHDRAFT_142483 [Amanita thiersii Skay4041]|uniref:Zn(2)-C6 fungal-type domain-containing protein n=1 Tax=Amanita thiersii Skay4041 TaxID=703135 RepID=A0A2A9NV49_9AGAR|nr:hypothetical protein AMATHDRAFT_142483 [Amanita thiersii Skay4041]